MSDIFDQLVKEQKVIKPIDTGDIFDRMAADPNNAVQVEDMTFDDMSQYYDVTSDRNNSVTSNDIEMGAPSIFDDSPETFGEEFYEVPSFDFDVPYDPSEPPNLDKLPSDLGRDARLGLEFLGGVGEVVAEPFIRLNKITASASAPVFKAVTPQLKNDIAKGTASYYVLQGLVTGDTASIKAGLGELKKLGVRGLIPFARTDWAALGDIPKSVKEIATALIPASGVVDDVKTLGQVWNDEYYSELTGEEAPWWGKLGIDVAGEDLATLGLAKLFKTITLANKVSDMSPQKLNSFLKSTKMSNKPLTSWEIKAGRKLFNQKGLAKLSPSQVRLELVQNKELLMKLMPDEIMKTSSPQLLKFKNNPIDELNRAIKTSPKAIKATEKIRTAERGKRFSKVGKARATVGKQAEINAKIALQGELPRVDIDPLNLSDEITFELNEMVRKSHKISDVEFVPTLDALNNLIKNGTIPARSRLKMLEKVFGPETIINLLKKRRMSAKVFDGFVEANRTINIMQTTGDLVLGRQGWAAWLANPLKRSNDLIRITTKEIAAASKKGFKNLPESIKKMNDSVIDSGHNILRRNAGIHAGEVGSVLDAGEELFVPKFLHKFLPIEVVENTNVLMLNTFRAHWFDQMADDLLRAGFTWQDDAVHFKKLASMVNSGTGRGDLPKLVEGMGVVPSLLFRSPRYMTSKVTYPYHVLTSSGPARKIVAKELLKTLGTGTTIIGIAKLYGELNEDTNVEIELDSRSSDFGKVEIDGVRYDIWGGNTQVMRAISRITTGLKKSAVTDEITDVEAGDVLWDFFRPKFAPTVGIAADIYYKENSIGKPVDPTTVDGIKDIAKDNFIAFFIQDLVEIAKTAPESLPAGTAVAFAGITVQAFEKSPGLLAYQEREKMSVEYFRKPYSEADLEERMVLEMYIDGTRPDILELDYKARAENLQIDSTQRDLELNRSASRVRKALDKDVNILFDEANIKPGGISRRINNVSLNRDGFLQYEKLYIKWLNTMVKGTDLGGLDAISKAEVMTQIMSAARETAKIEMQIK